MADLGVGPKVFIAYTHNPYHYEELQPPDLQAAIDSNPGLTREQLEQDYAREVEELETIQEGNIRNHMKLVHCLARFLQSNGVTVEYDQTGADTGHGGNHMKWFQDRIEASQYVMLIATPSLHDFLRGDVPSEREMLFTGEYLYNLIEGKSKRFLSVFLNEPKNNSLLPVSLRMGDIYHISEPFDVRYERSDDLAQLYALLTDQNRFVAPCAPVGGIVPIMKKKGRVGRGVNDRQQQVAAVPVGPHHRNFYDRLSKVQSPLTDMQITSIADKPGFYSQWKMLATHLSLSGAQIETCEVNSGGYNDSEKCLLMLKLWRDSGLYGPQRANSVCHLAHVLYVTLRNMTMLEILHNSVCI